MEEEIYKLSGLDKIKRAAMARYFSRMTEDERITAFKLAYDLAKQYLSKADENIKGKPEYFYGMFCLAIWKMNWTRDALTKKNPILTDEQSNEIAEKRLATVMSARKDRQKRGRLSILIDTRLYHVLRNLRLKGVSWRECSVYLSTHHKTRISHVHLYKLYRKISTERTIRGDE